MDKLNSHLNRKSGKPPLPRPCRKCGVRIIYPTKKQTLCADCRMEIRKEVFKDMIKKTTGKKRGIYHD